VKVLIYQNNQLKAQMEVLQKQLADLTIQKEKEKQEFIQKTTAHLSELQRMSDENSKNLSTLTA